MLIYAYTGINMSNMINLQIYYLNLEGKVGGITFADIPLQT